MRFLDAPAAALAWLGRQGMRAVAISVFAGLALPPLAALFKPIFAPTLVMMLLLAFLRVDPVALRGYFTRPGLVLAATGWNMLAVPVIFGLGLTASGIEKDGLYIALMLHAVAPPIISSAAIAALMGLDAALTLATLIVCIVLTPLTAPVFAALFIGPSMAISPLALGWKLFAILAGAALTAAAIRRIAGEPWVARQKERLDGVNVITLFVFAVALMDGVPATIMARPLLALGFVALAFALSLGLIGITMLIFARLGRSSALALGLAAGSRNMGLMMAAAGGAVPDLTWLYLAMVQFPIYLLPQTLKPAVWRLTRRAPRIPP